MKSGKWLVGIVVLAALTAVWAEDLVIHSFDRNGKIMFNKISGATGYRVEWASSPSGPWSTTWKPLDWQADTGMSSVVECSVPMFYRVVGVVTNLDNWALVPAGDFLSGNCMDPDEGGWPMINGGKQVATAELPVHTSYLSAFYIEKTEVTKATWDTVKDWAEGHGYRFTVGCGQGKAPDHPVHTLAWLDAAAWCNARSERDGLTPCYTNPVSGTVYRGENQNKIWWDEQANGYRLPTCHEWEKAARGGAAGHRFPWTDTDDISQARANYRAWTNSYDLSNPGYYDIFFGDPMMGYNPAYTNGGTPYTSPVKSFPANGFGIYDMAGNIEELCFDQYAAYWYDGSLYTCASTNPVLWNPNSDNRSCRGGSWRDVARKQRVATRRWIQFPEQHGAPANDDCIGFRCARSVLPRP